MRLSRMEEIGILCVCHIGAHDPVPVPLSDIAKEHGISLLFLKKIARSLKSAGLLAAKEGTGGGYILTRPLSEISVLSVFSAVGNQHAAAKSSAFSCPLRPSCIPSKIRLLVGEAVNRYLSDVTVDQFMKE